MVNLSPKERHLQLGRASFPVNSLRPGMQTLDSNTVKPAQKLWTLKIPWLTKLLLTIGSSVNGWPPSLPLFPFLFFLHLEAFGRSSLHQCHPQSLSFQHSPRPLPFGLFLSLSDPTLSFIQWKSLQPFSSAGQMLLNSIPVYSLWTSLAQALEIKEGQASKSLWNPSFPSKSYFSTLE